MTYLLIPAQARDPDADVDPATAFFHLSLSQPRRLADLLERYPRSI